MIVANEQVEYNYFLPSMLHENNVLSILTTKMLFQTKISEAIKMSTRGKLETIS